MRHRGRHAEAIAAYRTSLGLNPRSAVAWRLLGHVLDLEKDGRGVLEVYEQLRALDPAQADEFHEKHVAGRPWA